MQFHERLDMILESQDMTVADLARKSGISKQTIYTWKKRGVAPSIDFVTIIADTLGLSLDFMIRGDTTIRGIHPAQKKVLELMNTLSDNDKWRLLGVIESFVDRKIL